jgi:hypothetical protein
MMYVPHCLHAFRHVWKYTVGESAKLIDGAVEPFLLLHASDELSMLNGPTGDGIYDRQSCMRVDVNRQRSWYIVVACVCIVSMSCSKIYCKHSEISSVLVDAQCCVMGAAAGRDCTVVVSPAGPHVVGAAIQPCYSSIILR